jgi:hypothetical protein
LAAVAITWLLLDAPPGVGCGDDLSPAGEAFIGHAIAVNAVAAAATMATLVWLSSMRSADGLPGTATSTAVAIAALWMIGCLIDHLLFLPFVIVSFLPLLGGVPFGACFALAAVMIGAATWRRSMFPLSGLGWIVLLVAIPANMTAAWVQAAGPFTC